MIRVRPGNVYVLTSFYFETAYKAFRRLYRRYKGEKLLITPITSVKWISWGVRELGLDTGDADDIISGVIAKLAAKKGVAERGISPDALLPPLSFGRELLRFIGGIMAKGMNAAIFIDRPESRMMPVELVAFSKALDEMNKELNRNSVAVVILSTSPYARSDGFKVYFIRPGTLIAESKPFKAFAVADLMT